MIRIYAIIIFIVLLLAGLGGSYYFFNRWRRAEQQSNALSRLHGEDIKKISTYKNYLNNIVAKSESVQLENSTLRQERREGSLKTLEQFRGLKKNLNNLTNYSHIQASVIRDTVIVVDATGKALYDDTFNFGSIEVKGDTVSINDSTNVPLDIVVYWHRKWFLGRKEFTVEATSQNRKVKITGLESIVVKKN